MGEVTEKGVRTVEERFPAAFLCASELFKRVDEVAGLDGALRRPIREVLKKRVVKGRHGSSKQRLGDQATHFVPLLVPAAISEATDPEGGTSGVFHDRSLKNTGN